MCGTWTRCLEKGNGNPVRKKVRSPTTSECRFGLNLPPSMTRGIQGRGEADDLVILELV